MKKLLYGFIVCSFLCVVPNIYAYTQEGPTLDQLIVAQARVERIKIYIQELLEDLGIVKTYCPSIKDPGECMAHEECQWVLDSYEEGRCIFRGTLENDSLAGLALLILSQRVFELGEKIDQAIVAYPTPLYLILVAEACQQATVIRNGAKAGKIATLIPPPGLITQADFDPIIVEMEEVRNLLGTCTKQSSLP